MGQSQPPNQSTCVSAIQWNSNPSVASVISLARPSHTEGLASETTRAGESLLVFSLFMVPPGTASIAHSIVKRPCMQVEGLDQTL